MTAPDWDCAARRGLDCEVRLENGRRVVGWLRAGVVVVETAGPQASTVARLPGGPWQRVSDMGEAWDLGGAPERPVGAQGVLFG